MGTTNPTNALLNSNKKYKSILGKNVKIKGMYRSTGNAKEHCNTITSYSWKKVVNIQGVCSVFRARESATHCEFLCNFVRENPKTIRILFNTLTVILLLVFLYSVKVQFISRATDGTILENGCTISTVKTLHV